GTLRRAGKLHGYNRRDEPPGCIPPDGLRSLLPACGGLFTSPAGQQAEDHNPYNQHGVDDINRDPCEFKHTFSFLGFCFCL
ncbi:hypothetical protein ACFO6W_22775, partial [Dysgonomonas termitidis]